MEEATLFNGDCLDVMQTLPAGSIDAVICDPPYGTTACRWDSVIALGPMWSNLTRVIKTGGAIVLTAQTPFDKVLGASNIKSLKYEWIWEKTHPTGHLNAKRMPMKAHENVLVFYANQPTYNPIKTTGHKRKTAVKRHDDTQVYGAQNFDSIPYDSTERFPRSVLKFKSDKQTSKLHPTQKPVALMEYMVKTYTDPGQTVLDFTMGSGTTGVACKNLGRRFIGIELDEGYFNIAADRINSVLI